MVDIRGNPDISVDIDYLDFRLHSVGYLNTTLIGFPSDILVY